MDTHSRPTQCDRIISYMQRFGSISQIEALRDIGCMRLASRIAEIKKRGIAIEKEMKSAKNRYGENTTFAVYKLAE